MPDRRPFLPEDLLRLTTLAEAQISPNGTRVAYVQARVDQEEDEHRSQIYVVRTTGGPPFRWTNGPQRDSQPRWSPDGSFLAFVREVPDQKPQVYLMRADGGEAWQMTDMPKGVEHLAWSPDSRAIAFVAATGGDEKEPKDRSPVEKNEPRVVEHLNYKLDGTGYFDGRRSHIFVVAVESSAPSELPEPRQITDGDWDDRYPCWSPDGRTIAFTSYREADRHSVLWFMSDVWVVSAEGGEARRVTRSRGLSSLPIWSPDGASIAYIGHEQGKESLGHTGHVCVIPAAGGEPRIITMDLDRSAIAPPVYPAVTLAWSPDGRGLYFIAMDRGNLPIFYADLDGNVRLAVGGERQVTGLSLTSDGGVIAFTAMDTAAPPDVYVVQTGGGEERRLTDANRELLAEVELGQTERIAWKGADGWDIEGWVLRPHDYESGRRYPTILEIHGGPHGQYGNQFDPGWHTLAGAGYLVVYANPRGSTGYGEPFTLACVDDWGGKDYEDLMRGVDHVVAQGWADPERLGVGGYSYGGFMTSWIVGHTQRFQAAVVGAPVSNAYSFWGTSDIGPQFGHYEFGSRLPQEAPEHYLAGSPVQHLAGCETPVLLLHHEGDLRCPIGQSEEIFAVLKKLGKEVVMVRYPGRFHRYATHAPSQRVDAIHRMRGWFERFLGA